MLVPFFRTAITTIQTTKRLYNKTNYDNNNNTAPSSTTFHCLVNNSYIHMHRLYKYLHIHVYICYMPKYKQKQKKKTAQKQKTNNGISESLFVSALFSKSLSLVLALVEFFIIPVLRWHHAKKPCFNTL